jgi:MarR family transcriptional regulator, organic hydroperoxide resistance regulator
MPKSVDQPAGAAVGRVSHAIFRVARLHKELAGRLLRDIGLYPGQELLLMQLWDGGPQRQVDVLHILDSDAATMTRSVQRLEKAGLVSRTRNADDGRSVIIAATPASEPLRAQVEQVWRALEAATVEQMSSAQQAEAIQLLARLEDNLGRNSR